MRMDDLRELYQSQERPEIFMELDIRDPTHMGAMDSFLKVHFPDHLDIPLKETEVYASLHETPEILNLGILVRYMGEDSVERALYAILDAADDPLLEAELVTRRCNLDINTYTSGEDKLTTLRNLKRGLSIEEKIVEVPISHLPLYEITKINGGFRDLLNSNIGNDVIDGDTLYLCDFDTFHVVNIPENPTDDFLRRFYLQSFTEAAKSSLPFIDIVDTAEEAVKRYLAFSSFNHDFRREFYLQTGEKGWNLDRLAEIEKWAIATPIFRRTVGEVVLSYERLKEIPLREPTYKPH